MKKISVLVAICVMSVANFAFAQTHAQFITFDDTVGTPNAGTYNSTDTFGLDIFLTWAGYNSYGLSLWLETTANAAPHILLTGFTYGTTFDDPVQGDLISYPLGFTLSHSNGMYTTPNPSDLGSVVLDPHAGGIAPGTAFIGHLSISLSGLAPGIYTLQTDATLPHASVGVSCDGTTCHDEPIPVATYTITIVPEPSPFSLLVVATIAVGIYSCRRTVSNQSRS